MFYQDNCYMNHYKAKDYNGQEISYSEALEGCRKEGSILAEVRTEAIHGLLRAEANRVRNKKLASFWSAWWLGECCQWHYQEDIHASSHAAEQKLVK